MEYLDEQIIKQRQRQKNAEGDIYSEDGVLIGGDMVKFRECRLFQEKVSLWLPESFVDMPMKIARVKYPSEQRPQIIKTDLLGSTNFAFNLFDKPIKPTQMKSAADGMRDIIKKVNPANVFYEDGVEPLGDTQLAWFEFKGHGIDTQIYNIVYITSIGGKLLHGIFNCAIADRDEWRGPAFQVIRSIKDRTAEERS